MSLSTVYTNGHPMFDVIFEDQECLVIQKPSGVSVLRDREGHPNVYDLLREQYPEARLVHRLDKGTSGILVVARTKEFQAFASQRFARRLVRKFYVGVVTGHLAQGRSLVVDLPLKKGRKSKYRVAGLREEIRSQREGWFVQSENGLTSTTRLRVLEKGRRRSLVLLQPITGRTHQLRVHLSWIGHAIVGDTLYGAPKSDEQSWPRMLLHSTGLVLSASYSFKSRPPKEFMDGVLA